MLSPRGTNGLFARYSEFRRTLYTIDAVQNCNELRAALVATAVIVCYGFAHSASETETQASDREILAITRETDGKSIHKSVYS